MPNKDSEQIATFAGGCFWCTEAIFKRLRGVRSVIPGYTGGTTPNPTYEQVCSGKSGHAEAVEIHFNPDEISYSQLLEVFFKTHDPTTLNRQGADVGSQYRSSIFYYDDKQKKQAEELIAQLEESKSYSDPIKTKLEQADKFYPAEKYHQDYYDTNRYQPYCQIIIDPKIQKLYKNFGEITQDVS